MSKVLIHINNIRRTDYRITLPGLAIILLVFAAVLPYAIPSGDRAFVILATIALTGVSMGLLAGIPKLEAGLDTNSVMYGLLAMAVVGIAGVMLSYATLSSVKAVIIFAAVAEELGFRFGVQRLAEKVMGTAVALVFQAGLFMLYHWMVYPGYTFQAAYPLIAGLVFGAVNMFTRDLSSSLIAHVSVNVLVALSLG
jgi:membrane protease YdiL (CAAX protease family)